MREVGSWDDLAGMEPPGTKVIKLPETSKALGRDFCVRIKQIDTIDFAKALNFAIDEINAMVLEGATGEQWTNGVTAHAKTLSVGDMFRAIDSTLMIAIVDPEPTPEALKLIHADKAFAFREISRYTVNPEEAAEAAGFRGDGEQSST